MPARTHGRYSGWSAYRYGEESGRRQPYLAKGSKRPTIVPEKERRDLIADTAEILASAELSKFEHEASCRHGIRTTLTLQGNGWQLSNEEAAAIVTAALDRIGAVRPQFLEGQPEYTLSPGHQCQRCGAPLGDEAGHRRYCSPECYESARRYRNEFWQRTEDIARAAAAYATAKANAARCANARCVVRLFRRPPTAPTPAVAIAPLDPAAPCTSGNVPIVARPSGRIP